MVKVKAFFTLLLALMSAFLYGIYTYVTVWNIRPVDPESWVLTGLFGIMFLMSGINQWAKIINDEIH